MRLRLEAKGAPAERHPRDPELGRHGRDHAAAARQPVGAANELTDAFVVMHSGNIGHAQNLETLVRASTFLRDLDDLRILIIGGGARYLDLVHLAHAARGGQAALRCRTSRATCCRCRLSSADLHFVGLARGAVGLRRSEPAVRDHGRRPPGRRRGRRRQRDGAGRRAGRLRDRRAAQPARAARRGDPRRPRRRVRPGDMGARGRAYVEEDADTRVALGRYRTVLRELARRLMRKIFWGSLAALAWTHAGLSGGGGRGGAGRAAPGAARGRPADGDGDRRRTRRGGRDRAPRREPARARLPARARRDRRRLRRVDRRHGRDRRGARRARAARLAARLPARREGGGAEPRRLALAGRARRLLGRERDLGARRPAPARAQLRRSRGGVLLRPARPRGGRRDECRGRVLEARDLAPRAGGGDGLDHRRQRLDLRRAPHGLRRRRPALRPRPLVPVPHGPARPARRVRPRGARVREADAGRRGRVPAQGADVRARLADASRRPDAREPAARLPRQARLPPPSPLRQRRAARRPARLELRARAARRHLPARVAGGSSPCSRTRRGGRASPATTRSSPGARSSRSGTTPSAACQRSGTRRPAPARSLAEC